VTNLTRSLTALVALVLATSACAVASETSDPNAGVPQIVAVCAPESPDCDDTVVIDQGDTPDEDLFPDDEPRDGVTPPGASGMLVGGGLTVPEALATDATGVIAVQGFYFDDGSGPRLCEASEQPGDHVVRCLHCDSRRTRQRSPDADRNFDLEGSPAVGR